MVAFAGVLGCMSTCVSSPTMLICCTRVSCICNYVHLYLIQLYYLYVLLDLLDGVCFVRFACISFVRQTCDGLRSGCRRCACYCSAVPLNTHTHTHQLIEMSTRASGHSMQRATTIMCTLPCIVHCDFDERYICTFAGKTATSE